MILPNRPSLFQKYDPATAILVFLLCVPALLFILFPAVLGNRLGDVDTWFYFGHFNNFSEYRNIDANIARNYYQTRLPYTIPGFLVFSIFSDALAKFVFGYLVYVTIIFSVFYTLSAHLSRTASALAVVLLTSDIFFVRTFGWNYVDNGVLVYQALAFAALTAAAAHRNYRLWWVGLAAFCFTSMVFIHFGSAVLIFAFVGYTWFVLELGEAGLKEFARLLGAAIASVIACQLLYGLLNVAIWNSPFLFVLEQVAVGRAELVSMPQWLPAGELFRSGDWLAIHFAVWLASALALGAGLLHIVHLTRFHLFCFSSVLITYSLLFVLDYNRMGVFLSRQGEYASFFLVLSYMALAALISSAPRSARIVVGTTFLASLWLRLYLSSGAEVFPSYGVETWGIGLVIGAALGLAYLSRSNLPKLIALTCVAVPTMFIDWEFERSEGVYRAYNIIKDAAGDDLPRILADKNDPMYWKYIMSVTASFTERAWWLRGSDFPKLPNEAWDKNKVFVLSSRIRSIEEARSLLSGRVDDITPISFARIDLPKGVLWISGFEIVRRMSLPADLAQFAGRDIIIPAAALPSRTGRIAGDTRIATAESSKQGVLTFGPYAQLAPGGYDMVIHYGPIEAAHSWDVVLRDEDGQRIIASGSLEPTQSYNDQLTIPVTISKTARDVQVRTHYSGKGQLTVRAIAIRSK